MRERCFECFRPKSLCFCEAIPRIDNRTHVLILQHVGERFHPFNTARIVKKALVHCRLIVDHNRRMGARHLPIGEGAGLLYPGANAPSLAQLSPGERPKQLVIVDGTWHQAKTIVRDVPQLRGLPCFRLTPTTPGQYRIRREPDAQSLSTLEATVAALRTLEPDTRGLERLMFAFHEMVERQLGHPAGRGAWRKKRTEQSRPRNLPHVLSQKESSVIVAYGEATPGGPGQRTAHPLPVSWTAQRLGTSDRFTCCIRPPQPLPDTILRHMRLSEADFEAALSHDAFRHRWAEFLHRNDTLVVYHQRTLQLLQHIGASQPRCMVLKSIFGNWRTGFRSLEELMAVEGVPIPNGQNGSRADQRLEMAIAMVENLRARVNQE